MNVEPIGVFHGTAVRKYDQPRQGVFAGGAGTVELRAGCNFETALRDLDGFERIWLVFVFDRNGTAWRPTTRPPVAAPGRERVGLFASRAPYRPNPIGLSCVRLLSVTGRTLTVEEADLLDGTPILDIKPYIPAADAFPDAAAGWVADQTRDTWTVRASPAFAAAAGIVERAGGPDLVRAAELQLSTSPFDDSRKRVTLRSPAGKVRCGTLALRMFRIDFTADPVERVVTLTALNSGYTDDELSVSDDPYADKAFHRALKFF